MWDWHLPLAENYDESLSCGNTDTAFLNSHDGRSLVTCPVPPEKQLAMILRLDQALLLVLLCLWLLHQRGLLFLRFLADALRLNKQEKTKGKENKLLAENYG
jgi:hypothetical protein